MQIHRALKTRDNVHYSSPRSKLRQLNHELTKPLQFSSKITINIHFPTATCPTLITRSTVQSNQIINFEQFIMNLAIRLVVHRLNNYVLMPTACQFSSVLWWILSSCNWITTSKDNTLGLGRKRTCKIYKTNRPLMIIGQVRKKNGTQKNINH